MYWESVLWMAESPNMSEWRCHWCLSSWFTQWSSELPWNARTWAGCAASRIIAFILILWRRNGSALTSRDTKKICRWTRALTPLARHVTSTTEFGFCEWVTIRWIETRVLGLDNNHVCLLLQLLSCSAAAPVTAAAALIPAHARHAAAPVFA